MTMRLFGRRRERELDRELRQHLELEAEEQLAHGLSAREARHAAERAFGNTAFIQEEVREMWGWGSIDRLMQDLRYAARVLVKSPGFTAVAVLSLALGIGANTSVFSIADAVLLKTIPVSHPEQLRIFAWICGHDEPAGLKDHSGYNMIDDAGRRVDGSFSYPAFEAFRKLPQFSDVFAFAQNQFTITAAGTSDIAYGHYVSGSYFSGLGAQPLIGRAIVADDDTPGSARVVVLSHLYWERRFGGDPSIIGSVLQVNRRPVTVVGVMPRGFQGLQPGPAVDVFVPMSMAPETAHYYSLTAPDNWWVEIFGRLKPGIAEAAAREAIEASLAGQIESYAGVAARGGSVKIVLEPGGGGIALLRGSLQTTIFILTAAAVLILLIACLNLANLLLARYAARAKEIAVRVSIGASRARLLRQMLTESLLVAGAGAAAGLLLANAAIPFMLAFFGGTGPLGLDARLDPRALAFTFATAILTALLFGILPAWRASRIDAGPSLKETSHGQKSAGGKLLAGRYLVSLQVSLSLLLLIGTGLFLRTLMNLAAVDLGFDTDRVLTFQTDPQSSGYKPADAPRIYRRIEERIAAIPGVQSVGMSQQALIARHVTNGGVRLAGESKLKQTWFLDCSNSFLATLGISVLRGRDLSRADFDQALPNAVVNETFVKKYLPGANPLGQIFYSPDWVGNSHPEQFTIVGVAKDAHYSSVRDEAPPTAYVPYPLKPVGVSNMAFVIRTRVAPLSLAAAVRKAVASVDAGLPVAGMRTEREQIDLTLGTERMFAALVTSFGVIALVLAAVGLYGIMAFSVARRTSEIGIRMALGARRGNVQWLVLRQSLMMAALGVAVGVPGALELTNVTEKLLYGVKPNDLVSIVGAVAVMIGVGALAAWIPARRAARVDPMVALRYE
jgi:predicted permease